MFTTDNRTENFLTSLGVEFKYTNAIRFSDLRGGWDKDNLSRPVAIREEAVFEYASLIETGSPAPAVILVDTDNGFRVLDGVQRLAAARIADCTQVSAYVVSSDSEDTLLCINVLANARLQGRAEPPEWTRRRAVEVLVLERGMSIEEVARMGGWKVSDIASTARVLEWGKAICSIGGPGLTDSVIEVIADRISVPICDFMHTLKRAKLSAKDATAYADEFFAPITKASNKHSIYAGRLAAIKEDPEIDIRLHGRRGTGQRKDVSIVRALKSVLTLLDEVNGDSEPLRYVDEFFRLLKSIDDKIRECAPQYPKKQQARTPADMWSDK
jgi:hypothetical protein